MVKEKEILNTEEIEASADFVPKPKKETRKKKPKRYRALAQVAVYKEGFGFVNLKPGEEYCEECFEGIQVQLLLDRGYLEQVS